MLIGQLGEASEHAQSAKTSRLEINVREPPVVLFDRLSADFKDLNSTSTSIDEAWKSTVFRHSIRLMMCPLNHMT